MSPLTDSIRQQTTARPCHSPLAENAMRQTPKTRWLSGAARRSGLPAMTMLLVTVASTFTGGSLLFGG